MIAILRQVLTLLAALLLTTPVVADSDEHHSDLFPRIAEPEGKECVQPEDEMRRNHMNYILHQRDETMHRGIRANIEDEGYSLAQCIDCHVFPDENGNIANHDEEEHFCNTCHQYASVQIDCFDCHADKPQKYIKRGGKTTADLKQQLHQVLVSTANDGSKQ